MSGILGNYMPFKGASWKQPSTIELSRVNEVLTNTNGSNASRYLVPIQLAMYNYSDSDWKGPCDGVATDKFKQCLKDDWEGAYAGGNDTNGKPYGKQAIPMTKDFLKAILEDGGLDPSVVVD